MKARKTYTMPETENVTLGTHDRVMQDSLQDTFSGGDRSTGITIDKEADESNGDSRSNHWGSHLWDEME